MNRQYSKAESGNVLFLILIAVALFAALSFAISQSTRGGSGSASKEKNQLLLDQLSQNGSSLAQAITRVILGNGCTIDNVSFDSPRWPAPNEYIFSTYTPADGRCNVYTANGGAVVWQPPPYEALAVSTSLYGITGNIAVTNIGTTQSELSMTAEVTRDVCLLANTQDKVVNTGGNPPYLTAANSRFETPMPNYKAAGTFAYTTFGTRFPNAISVGGATDAPELNGHHMGCYEAGGTGSGIYVFYQVLVPR